MSWLNFNESLNSIKGQLSNFASGVLAEGIVKETEDDINGAPNSKPDHSEGQQSVHSLEKPSQNIISENGNTWAWESPRGEPPPVRVNFTSDLQKKIEILENEKKDLITSLEQLDSDYQQTTDKLVMLKDNLQTDYNELKNDFEKLQKEYGEVLKENMEKSKEIGHLQKQTSPSDAKTEHVRSLREENEMLNKKLLDSQNEIRNHIEVLEKFENLKKEYENYKKSSEKEKVNAEELQRLCKKLENENAQLCAKIQGKQEENVHSSKTIEGDDVIRQLEDKNVTLIRESEELSLKIQVLTHENEELQDVNQKLKSDYQSLKTESEKLKNTLEELQKFSEELKNSNVSVEDECRRLKNENAKLNSNHSKLQEDHAQLKQNLEIVTSTNELTKKQYEQLKDENKKLSGIYEELKVSSGKLKSDLEKLNDINSELKNEYQHLKVEHEKLKSDEKLAHDKQDIDILQSDYETLKASYEKVLKEKQTLHEKYVSIITENMQKYMESNADASSNLSPVLPEEHPQILEFAGKVEALLKLLLDFKSKTETLEKELYEVTQEKNKTVTEKNFEIEKLLQNSEVLSQEVITKSQIIKDYEEECAELMKNNDLLISELQNYKNTSGLQTISEGNEDNMLLLESQVENANKKIQDLEIIISDLENSKQEVNLETQTELDYIKKQLNMTGQELNQSKEEYQNLFVQYKQLEEEKHSLKLSLDKMKGDYENTEYKYTEVNVSMETLKEENEEYKHKIIDLDASRKKLESLNLNLESKIELLQNIADDFKQKLELEVENTKQKELQIRNLVERLQNSKMSETGLKLQVDTIYKELQSVTETKQNLEAKYAQTLTKLEELKEDLRKTKEEFAILHSKQLGENSAGKLEKPAEDFEEKLRTLNEEVSVANFNVTKLEEQLKTSLKQKEIIQIECTDAMTALSQVSQKNTELQQKIAYLEAQLIDVSNSRNELIALITAKHQENVQYHTEIQRLSHLLTAETEKAHLLETRLQDVPQLPSFENHASAQELAQKIEEIEKLTDQNTFLREKCEVLAQNLLQEQSNLQKILSERSSASDKEQALAKELERLRAHLVEIEETYTEELLQAENKNKEMRAKVNEIEQREKDSSSIYTSVSIRANQQVETLQTQLQLVTNQRDELRVKISDIEDENNKHVAALTNLQLVLEQFQKDKEKDVFLETERVRRQIGVEKHKQQELQAEINNLKMQLEESKQGLQAASRLSDQLENCKRQITSLKDEVSKLQDQLKKSETKYKELTTQTDSKVDKNLIKNLVIGYINSSMNDQHQILKIIATVLDFNQKESDKVNLNKPQQGGWLSSILHPQSLTSNQDMTQQSLSEAFVRFLENESKPKVLPNLLNSNPRKKSADSSSSTGSTTPRQSPLVLSEVVLPTFTDFGKSRNSSSILKDVLKDNT